MKFTQAAGPDQGSGIPLQARRDTGAGVGLDLCGNNGNQALGQPGYSRVTATELLTARVTTPATPRQQDIKTNTTH